MVLNCFKINAGRLFIFLLFGNYIQS